MSGLKRLQLFSIDGLLLNLSFFIMHAVAGWTPFDGSYRQLWLSMNGIWLVVAFWEKKVHRIGIYGLKARILFSLRNALYMLYLLSILLVMLGLTGFTRYHILGTFALYWLLTVLLFAMDQWISKSKSAPTPPELLFGKWRSNMLRRMAVDLLFLLIAYATVHELKYDTFIPVDNALEVLLILSAVWLLTAVFTEKFRQMPSNNIYYALSPFIKSFFIAVALMSIMVFALRLFRYSRTLIFGSLLGLLMLELIWAMWRQVRGSRRVETGDIETAAEVKAFIRQHELPEDREQESIIIPADQVLQRQALADWPEIYTYLSRFIHLDEIDISRVRILDTGTPFNIRMLSPASLRLFVNLHMANDFERLNEYFLQVHSKLKSGGYFLVRKKRLENYRERLESKLPSYIATLIYVFHFFWHRVCPKLPVLQRFYFFFSGNKSRVVTRAEMIGRLHFCGFRLINFEHIGNSHWFLVQKSITPSLEVNPSNGPLIKLKRVGYLGRTFYLFKFRTMHPYAEFLQEYIFQEGELDETGKFKDDFRLTQWGKVMRRYWIDELPQFINFVRGDIRLFGVRAISPHYFSLYPEDVQGLRTQFKPGLIPPYYADMPKNFEEIVDSERRYLLQKGTAPLRTDFIYSFRALHNILLRRAHSK